MNLTRSAMRHLPDRSHGSPEVRRVMQIHPWLLSLLILAWMGVNAARRTTDTATGWKCGPLGWVVILGLLAVISYAVLFPHSAS